MLACKLRKQQEKKTILRIQDDNTTLIDNVSINKSFHDFIYTYMKGKKRYWKILMNAWFTGFTKTHINSEINNEQSHNNFQNIGSYKENFKRQETRARWTVMFISQFMF